MDGGYNTMVLDLYFVIMEKNHFFHSPNGCLVAAAPPYLHLLCFPCLALSIIVPCTYTQIKDKEN
jgi:hypothetical protein